MGPHFPSGLPSGLGSPVQDSLVKAANTVFANRTFIFRTQLISSSVQNAGTWCVQDAWLTPSHDTCAVQLQGHGVGFGTE